jgi:hypothetical protein
MDKNTERILVVHSVSGTDASEIDDVAEAIRTFARPDSSVRTEPEIFRVPTGAAPGATLGTELTRQLRSCIGAVVFVDDLRPNVAYELGFFHGRGRTVLLLTDRDVDAAWMSISDLAGAALHRVNHDSSQPAVHAYLSRLYDELSSMPPWPVSQLPSEEHNLIAKLPDQSKVEGVVKLAGDWGPSLRVSSWNGIDLRVGLNLLPDARFKLVLRAVQQGADYSVYFRVRFQNQTDDRRRVWLGLTSLRRASGFQSEERTFPAQPLTTSWQTLNGGFQDLLERGHLIVGGPSYYLETLRIRAGRPHLKNAKPIEVGFVEIIGVDR